MTNIITDGYKPIDIKKTKKTLNEIMVFSDGYRIEADKLRIITKTKKVADNKGSDNPIADSIPVKSVLDIVKNKNKLCFDETLAGYTRLINPTFSSIEFFVPKEHASISLNKDGENISYGLKRTLTVDSGTKVENSKFNTNSYLYVKVAGEWTFLHPDKIFYYEGATKKTYLDAISSGENISNLNFFDELDKQVSDIYTEYEYKFLKTKKYEKADLNKKTISTISVDEDGTETVESKRKINQFYSDQKYSTITVDDENKPGKTKNISVINTTNYQMSNNGEYFAVTVTDGLNSHIKLVKAADFIDKSGKSILTDENGNSLTNLAMFVGKKVKFKDGETIKTTEPLTYEQATVSYETVKTYQEQESNVKADEETCLKLDDGTYVKELSSVQPQSFRIVSEDSVEFDKLLVKNSEGKYVLVNKDYFTKHGQTKNLDASSAIKVVGCDINSKDCSIVQTTSTEDFDEIADCSIVLKGAVKEAESESKSKAYEDFKLNYTDGKYAKPSVYIKGKKKALDKRNKRYKHTEVSQSNDHADELLQYQALKTQNLEIKDGKVHGGPHFDIGKGINKNFKKLGNIWKKALGFVLAAGIFLPVAGPFIAAACVTATAVAIPTIPIATAIYGARKNAKKDYVDKTKYNRTIDIKSIKQKFNTLSENLSSLNEKQFEDEYSKIMLEVARLSQTTSNNTLNLQDGKAKVDANNVKLSSDYIKQYNFTKNKLEACERKIKKLKAKGKVIPQELQAEFDNLTKEMDLIKNNTIGSSYGIDNQFSQLQDKAKSLKLFYQLTVLKDASLLASLGLDDSTISKLAWDNALGLTIDGLPLNPTEKQLKKAFKKDATKLTVWTALRDKVLEEIAKVEEPKVQEAENAQTDQILSVKEQIEELYQESVALNTEINNIIGTDSLFHIVLSLSQENNEKFDKLNALYEESKDLLDLDSIQIKLDSMREQNVALMSLKENAELVKSIENETQEVLHNYVGQTKLFIEDEIQKEVKNKDQQDEYMQTYSALSENFNEIYDQLLAETDLENIKNMQNSLEDLKGVNKELDELVLEVNREIKSQSIKGRLELADMALKEFRTLQENKKNDAATKHQGAYKVDVLLKSMINLQKGVKNLYEESLNENNKDANNLAHKKAIQLSAIMNYACDTLSCFFKIEDDNLFIQANEYIYKLGEELSDIKIEDDVEKLTNKRKVVAGIKEHVQRLLSIEKGKTQSKVATKRKSSNKAKDPNVKTSQKSKSYNTQINSEDSLVEWLKANPNKKERKKLIDFILKDSGVEISDEDINETIARIDEKHTLDVPESATKNAGRLKNKNIALILEYGQKYLTIYAKDIKLKTKKPKDLSTT